MSGPVNDIITDIPDTRISFDYEAFDNLLRSQGVRFVHWQATRCPVGMVDLDDNRRPHEDHANCTNGFLYEKVGIVTILFTSNSKTKNKDDLGYWDGSTVQVTLPRFYDDQPEKRVYIAPFDRLYLEEESIMVPSWQLFKCHETGDERLKYKAEQILFLIDSRGEKYTEGQDFCLHNGHIRWTGRRPVGNIDLGPLPNPDPGAICSVRYLYRPYYYVGQIVHEVRVSQLTDDVTGERHAARLPQAAVLHREYVGQSRDQRQPGDQGQGNSGSPPPRGIDSDAMRTVLGPMNGGFNPR